MKTFSYPGPPPRARIRNHIIAYLKTVTESRAHMRGAGITLDRVGAFRPLQPNDLPLIVASHNEERFLRSFLAHYRRLGVTRFLWVDDASTDGSRRYLEQQLDVDLHVSNVRYKQAERGRIWRHMLAEKYGWNRWYVNVDADEFLVYRDHEKADLKAVTAALEKRGIKHALAPMIELYPRGPVSQARFEGQDETPPWEIASHFDAEGYFIQARTRGWTVGGGFQARAMKQTGRVTKFPLLYWTKKTSLARTIHNPSPYQENLGPPFGVLLHFKFFSDFEERFKAVIQSAQHARNAKLYSDTLALIENPDTFTLESGVSAPYRGAEDLFRRGFFSDWRA